MAVLFIEKKSKDRSIRRLGDVRALDSITFHKTFEKALKKHHNHKSLLLDKTNYISEFGSAFTLNIGLYLPRTMNQSRNMILLLDQYPDQSESL